MVVSRPYFKDFDLEEISDSSATITIVIKVVNELLTNTSGETINLEDSEHVTFKYLRIQSIGCNGICIIIEAESSRIMLNSCNSVKINWSKFSSYSLYFFVTGVANVFTETSDLQMDITISNNFFRNGSLTENNSVGYAAIVVCQDFFELDDCNVKIINNDIEFLEICGIIIY